MENKKASETLDGVCVKSKVTQSDNPSNKIIKKAKSVFLCNLNEKCTSDVYCGQDEISHVEEFAGELGNGTIVGSNLISNGTMGSCGNEIKDNDLPVLEGELKFSRNGGVQVGKVEQPTGNCNNVLHPHEPGSSTNIDVSRSRISLFVEVFGPLDGMSEGNSDLDDTREHTLRGSIEDDGTMHSGVQSAKNEEEAIVGEQEYVFDVSDLVWVKTRTQLWWPGIIYDPSNAESLMTNSEKRGSILVKYFGNANLVWCNNSELKPFTEYYEQMSGQNNSRNFFGSVEKALCEIGRRVKSMMTCRCFSKESQTLAAQFLPKSKERSSMSLDKRCKSDDLLFAQFKPASFYASIRHLARSVHAPGKLELTVMKNRLSAFYCSIGHYELPLRQLRSSSDAAQNAQDELADKGTSNISGRRRKSVKTNNYNSVLRRGKRNRRNDADQVLDKKIASSGKGSKSRERKKSKYLSYPYINVNRRPDVTSSVEPETEDPSHCPSLSTESTPLGSGSGVSSQQKESRKPSNGQCVVSEADNINVTSAELLAELLKTARDCFYINESNYADSLKRFCSSFRVVSFLDADTSTVVAGRHQEPNGEKSLPQNSTEAEVVKEPKNQKVNLASVKETVDNVVDNQSPKTDDLKAKGNDVHKRAKKKKEHVISAGLQTTINCSGMGANTNTNSSWVISFQQTCSDVNKSRTTPKKAEGDNPVLPQMNVNAQLPDLNGNISSFSVEQFPSGGPATNLVDPVPKQRKEGLVFPNTNGVDQMASTSVTSLMDASVTLHNILQFNNGVNGSNHCQNAEFRARVMEPSGRNTGFISFVQPSLQLGLFPPAANSKPKERKRKEKTCQVAPVIPDLNGNVFDTSSLGKSLPDGNHTSPEGVPEPKRRRKKSANAESSSDGKINGEALGGSLLLNFAPGFPLPSKETLVAKFSRFGLLKESEIQVLEDSSVQIVYERSSDARFAFRSLEKSSPFGELLASFKLQCIPFDSRTTPKKNKSRIVQPFVPVDTCKGPVKPGETPDIAVIRQNVEMMKLTLEKSGANLSPEMRSKLENEIKVFLDKLSSMGGSSSS